MRRYIPALLAVLAIGVSTSLQAQNKSALVGFVTSQKVLEAHPNGPAALAIQTEMRKELAEIQARAKVIRDKGANATAAEKQQLETLARTFETTQKRYQDRYEKMIEPITKDVDVAVKGAANAKGFSIVMDRAVAQSSGLVVYADDDTDLTPEVIKRLPRR